MPSDPPQSSDQTQQILALTDSLTALQVVRITPLAEGEGTAAYSAYTRDGRTLIVRVQKRGVSDFNQEGWAMARCREAGVPVPEVHSIYDAATTGLGAVMVMDQARGRPLSDVLPSLSPDDVKRVFVNVGALLGRLHQTSAPAFGWLRREGNEPGASDWVAYARELLGARQKDAPMLEAAGLNPNEVGELLEAVSSMADLPYRDPVLCHGDVGADHLFVNDALDIVDLIDFGLAQGSAPALDVAVLQMFHPEVERAWLAERYGSGLLEREGFGREVLLHQVNAAMSFLGEQMRRGEHCYKDIAVQGLRSWLIQLT